MFPRPNPLPDVDDVGPRFKKVKLLLAILFSLVEERGKVMIKISISGAFPLGSQLVEADR